MPTAEEIASWDSNHFWHSFTQMAEYQSVVIDRAEGVWLYDTEGNRYLDGVSSMWCNLFGHQHPRINKAIQEQLDLVAHSTSLGQGNTVAALLAKRLGGFGPWDAPTRLLRQRWLFSNRSRLENGFPILATMRHA